MILSQNRKQQQSQVLDLIKKSNGITSSRIANHFNCSLELVEAVTRKLEGRKIIRSKLIRKNTHLDEPLQRETTWYASE